MNGIVSSFICALLAATSGRTVPDRTAAFLSPAWELVTDSAKVDAPVTQALLEFIPTDKPLAARDEPFEATDIVSDRPTRRFLLAGKAVSRWFVAYEHGGRGHHIHLVVFDTAAAKPAVQFAATGTAGKHDDIAGWRVSLQELRAAVTSRELREVMCDEF